MSTTFRLLGLLMVVLAADVTTKAVAEGMLPLGQPLPILGEAFRLTLGYNPGVAFGLFASGGIWPAVVSGTIVLGVAAWLVSALRRGTLSAAIASSLGLLLGGAIANLVDRLPDGRVTDFLDFGLGAYRWPAFNLADTFVVLAVAALVLATLGAPSTEAEPRQTRQEAVR